MVTQPHARSIRTLANRQAARWTHHSESQKAPIFAPCVALSRWPASGGEEIAGFVAETLDYGLFGKEIVSQIAEEQGVGNWLVAGLDEQVRSGIDRFITDAFRTRAFTEDHYIREVTRIIATLGRRGMAVILGRGAPFILPAEQALRVLVVAPRTDRVERLMKRDRSAREQAEEILKREDETRRKFLLQSFGVDQDDPSQYDLIVNTGQLRSESTARIVVAALKERFPQSMGATER